MTKFSVGDMVMSLCGRDKGRYLIVIAVDGDRVIVCDGKSRKAEAQKKKKIKHVKFLGLHSDLINGLQPYEVDAKVRREIKRLRESM